MYRIGEFLTPRERIDAMRLGGIRKLAEYGLKPSDMTGIVKSAAGEEKIGLLGAALRTSVLIGAPLGAIWYVVSSGLRDDSEKTRRMKATLDHYNYVVDRNRKSLSGII